MTTIKGYELTEQIGEGGFGVVHRATQATVGREVAIKIIAPHLANDPNFIRRFETEAQLIARTEHPHIVPLFDFWREPDGAYLVMRYLRGGNLKDLLNDGALDIEQAGQIFTQITSALGLAHRKGIIHRDLKPSNILLDEDGNAYLTDFGIAKDITKSEQNTQSGAVMGTLGYMAPEQARGAEITPRTDVYSLGVILYEMLKGEHPFPNLTPIEQMYKHLNEALPLLDNLSPEVVDIINGIIQRATEKNPAHRYADALAFGEAFKEVLNTITPTTSQSLVETLTRREQEILQAVIDGKSNKEIAQASFLTVGTVKWYVNQIYKKLGVRNRVQATVKARELNLIVGSSKDVETITYSGTFLMEGVDLENPYKGLQAFTSADKRDFFGREKITQKLIQRLHENGKEQRFLAVVGPSGSGKSSLVKAGLVPNILSERVFASGNLFVIDMLPGNRPLDELEIALTRIAVNQNIALREHLERDAFGLMRAAQLILPDDNSELLIVIDQFEEVFTLVEDESERQQFLDLIYTAVTEKRSRVRVILTLRADFYDRPLQYVQFGELIRDRVETILPLSAEELERAIVEPARRLGVKYEEGLVASIIGEINYQPGALPLLQYALTEVFDRRDGHTITHAAYQEIGKAVGALAKRADEIYLDLTPSAQNIARQVFSRMVTLGEGTEDTRRRVVRSELLAITPDTDLVDDVLDVYAQYRLLSFDNDPATRTPNVEVAHEALLREWERLREWLNEGREDIKLQRTLSQLAETWQSNGQDTSYLVSGNRLHTFETWAKETELALTPTERQFLAVSIAEYNRQEAEKREQKQREIALSRRAHKILQTLVAVFVIATIIASVLAMDAMDARAEAQGERDKAQSAQHGAERESDLSKSLALASSAQQALLLNNTDLAIALALEANSIENPPLQAYQALFDSVYSPGTRIVLRGHTGPVTAVDISPDGQLIISGGRLTLPRRYFDAETTVSTNPREDYSLRLWDLQTGQEIHRFVGHIGPISDVKFTPDGKQVISASADESLIVWDVATGEIVHQLWGHNAFVNAVDVSPDGKIAVSAANSRVLIMWDLTTGQIIRRLISDRTNIDHNTLSVNFSPDGRLIIASDTGGFVDYWDAVSGEYHYLDWGEGPFHGYKLDGVANHINFSQDSRYMLTSSWIRTIEDSFAFSDFSAIVSLWDLTTGKEIRRFHDSDNESSGVTFSHDDQLVISARWDGVITIWETATGRILYRLSGQIGLRDMAISRDGKHLVTASEDKTIRVWDLTNGTQVTRLAGHTEAIQSLSFNTDGSQLVSGASDRKVILWDFQHYQLLRKLHGHNNSVAEVVFSSDGTQVYSADYNGAIRAWNVITGQGTQQLHVRHFPAIAFSPSRRYIGINDWEHWELWDLETGQKLRDISGYTDLGSQIEFDPTGRWVITSGTDNILRVWDIAESKELIQIQIPLNEQHKVAFHPDGNMILVPAQDRRLWLIDLTTGKVIRRFEGHQSEVYDVAISPDGKFALSASEDNQMILWDIETGILLGRFIGHRNGLNVVAFSPDGRYGLSGGDDGDIIVWELHHTPESILAWAEENRYIRDLSCYEREFYGAFTLCDTPEQVPPTRTPYPTLLSTTEPSPTPTLNLALMTATMTQTPLPSLTPSATPTLQPPQLVFGRFIQATLEADAGKQTWTFDGESGENITILFTHFGLKLTLTSPDGTEILQTTQAQTTLELPQTGKYQVIVESDTAQKGAYSLRVTQN